MSTTNTPHPETQKMVNAAPESQSIGEFVEWMGAQGIQLAEFVEIEGYSEPKLMPVSRSLENMLADYFGIDLKAVEKERRKILASLRD